VINAVFAQRQLELITLGLLEVRCNGVTITAELSLKAKSLLVYLACTKQSYSRVYLAELLWPEREEKQALSNLRTLLARLPDSLKGYFNISRDAVAMTASSAIFVDAQVLQQKFSFVAGCKELSRSLVGEVESSLPLYQGEFLQGFCMSEFSGLEDWISQQRQNMQSQFEGFLNRLVNFYFKEQDYLAALPLIKRLLQLDPLREESHQQMLWLLAYQGQRSAALEHYRNYRSYLSQELNIAPEAATTDLYEQIKTGKCGWEDWLEKLIGRPNPTNSSPVAVMASKTSSKITQLQRISLFQGASIVILNEVAELLEGVEYGPQETVFSKGDLGNCLYMIVRGQVRVHDGQRTLNVLSTHDIFGEMAVLDVAPRLASVTTLSQTYLWKLEQATFYRLMEAQPEFSRAIIKILTRWLRERVNDVAELDAQMERLVRVVNKPGIMMTSNKF
jgi:DNA-binding SARP family transcriptional activator